MPCPEEQSKNPVRHLSFMHRAQEVFRSHFRVWSRTASQHHRDLPRAIWLEMMMSGMNLKFHLSQTHYSKAAGRCLCLFKIFHSMAIDVWLELSWKIEYMGLHPFLAEEERGGELYPQEYCTNTECHLICSHFKWKWQEPPPCLAGNVILLANARPMLRIHPELSLLVMCPG